MTSLDTEPFPPERFIALRIGPGPGLTTDELLKLIEAAYRYQDIVTAKPRIHQYYEQLTRQSQSSAIPLNPRLELMLWLAAKPERSWSLDRCQEDGAPDNFVCILWDDVLEPTSGEYALGTGKDEHEAIREAMTTAKLRAEDAPA